MKVFKDYKEACHKLKQQYKDYDNVFLHKQYTGWVKPHRDKESKPLLCEIIGNNTYMFFHDGIFTEIKNGNCVMFDCRKIHALFSKYPEEYFEANIYRLTERV